MKWVKPVRDMMQFSFKDQWNLFKVVGGGHIAPLVEINTNNEYRDNSSLYSLIQLTLELLIDLCKIIVWFSLPLTLHCIFFRYCMSRSLFQPGKLSYGKIVNWILHLRKQPSILILDDNFQYRELILKLLLLSLIHQL